jgi:TldD protein
MPSIDPSFTALPLSAMADAALDRARELGAEHADVRVERVRGQQLTSATPSVGCC